LLPLYVGYRAVMLSLLVIVFVGDRSIWLTQLLILLGFSVVEGRLLGLGVLVGDGKHLLRRPGIFHGELVTQGWISELLLEEHDWFVIDLWDNVPFVAETQVEFPKGLPFLLHNVGLVPLDSWPLTGGPGVIDELMT
jgi:hypothetical protein